jgi:hypothetical protein
MEPGLYTRLTNNFDEMKQHEMQHYINLPPKKLMSAKLIDV